MFENVPILSFITFLPLVVAWYIDDCRARISGDRNARASDREELAFCGRLY